MKKYFRILSIPLAVVTMLLSGCESWLDVNPKSQVKEEKLFRNEEGFRDALSGIYTIMGRTGAYGGPMTMGLVEMLSQTYSSVARNYEPAPAYNYGDAVIEGDINRIWSSLYNAVANCNYLLHNIEVRGDILTDDVRAMAEAEALAVRAYLHFDLLRAFAPAPAGGAAEKGIPFVDRITGSPVAASTVPDVLDRIIADVERARTLAAAVDPIRTDPDYTEDYATTQLMTNSFWLYRSTRMNYYGMTALAARAYLYKGDRTKALECAREVIDSDRFRLLTDEIVREESKDYTYVESMGRHEYISSLYVYNLKEDRSDNYFRSGSNACVIGLPRKTEIFGSLGIDLDLRSKNLFVQPAGETNEYCAKYYSGTKIPLLKLSEMYLIAAEASDDITYLEKLRSHRGYASSPLPEGTSLTSAITDEYRREFIAEGQLFFHYKRMGMSSIPFTTVTMGRAQYIFPLPDDEIEFGI